MSIVGNNKFSFMIKMIELILLIVLFAFGGCSKSNLKSRPRIITDSVGKIKGAVVLIKTSGGCGTGVNVSVHGMILTAYHLVKGIEGDTFTVTFPKAGKLKAVYVIKLDLDVSELMGFDFTTDIAILGTIPKYTNLPYADVGSLTLSEGEEVYFYGYPLCGTEPKERPSLGRGIISEFLTAEINDMMFHPFKMAGIINPGNSGGPIFDPYTGKVVGLVLKSRNRLPKMINKHILTVESDTISLKDLQPISGIGYGISIEPIVEVINSIKENIDGE